MILAGAVIAALACLLGFSGLGGFAGSVAAAFLVGGMANPLYGILLAYTNDYLEQDAMAGASARLLFVNGLGAVGGPLVTGWLIARLGPEGFWVFPGALMATLAAYALWRMTRRPVVDQADLSGYVPMAAGAVTPVTITTAVDAWEDRTGAEADTTERAA